jgi:hypothetical protein
VVSWFGSDLRCAHCRLRPKVEQAVHDGVPMPWQVSGLARAQAAQIPLRQGRSVYGGTPADASVLEAIEALKEAGQAVMFYPFILMDQGPDNLLPDPYSDQTGQAAYPWRGRITLSKAPNQPGSPDRGPGAAEEIAAFFGQAQAADFTVSRDAVSYSGPADDWGYNRFILHYAALCARAGGVAAFCIGSEMRGLSAVRDQSDSFLDVTHLQDLAQQVRRLLGPEVKLGYAADWSEYFGYRPAEADGDMIFHLDPLWSSSDIDFIGIDNYMPLSDWRDGIAHKDAAWGSLYDLAYLTSNIAGGEGYDWYYPTSEARNVQSRKPIEDTAHDEAWIWRYKDLKSWWSQKHYNRINGLRSPEPTQWQPKSKPIWFTELGVAAVDKATNQPNVFFDPKSSESALPYFSVGQRDDYIQMQYLRALHLYWAKPEHNPESDVYSGRMLDRSRMFVWTWDARPFPYFPAAEDLWADGENYARGHWITGRVSGVSLAAVVAEICERSGLFDYDVSDLHGYVRGYKTNGEESARGLLQPLALHFGFDAVERQGVVRFLQRGAGVERPLDLESLVDSKALEAPIEWRRDGATERVGRLQQSFVLAQGVYDVVSEEVQLASDSELSVSQTETGLVLTRAEARQAMRRWLVEARLAKDTIRFALPPSQRQVSAGDRVRIEVGGRSDSYRIDRVELGSFQTLTGVRSDAKLYQPQPYQADRLRLDRFVPPLPVFATFLDLPSLSGDEQPQAPYVAASAEPWPGRVAVYASYSLDDYALAQVITRQSYIGRLCSPLPAGPLGLIDRGTQLLVEMPSLPLSSIKLEAFLAGQNKMAIGDGSAGNWEIVQFQFAALRQRGVYQLSGLLRGLHGSDAIMPDEWPSGSLLVTLDQAPPQLSVSPIKRGIERHFRIGPAAKPFDDPIFQSSSQVFLNNVLRPYRPCHIEIRIKPAVIEFTWLRRGRVDADLWQEGEIPLAEAAERYRVRILAQSVVLREAYPERPVWTYEKAWYVSDLKTNNMNGLRFEVAQLSDRFGPGPSAYITISENLEVSG